MPYINRSSQRLEVPASLEFVDDPRGVDWICGAYARYEKKPLIPVWHIHRMLSAEITYDTEKFFYSGLKPSRVWELLDVDM